jgi:FkbM family methyltransferase
MTPIGRLLQGMGLYGGRLRHRAYGEDMIHDIKRLSHAWNLSLETVFDVGANAGQSALKFDGVFPGARIFSFEPHPKTFQALKSKVSGRPNIEPFNLAMGDEDGEVDFFEYDDPLINSRVAGTAYTQREGLKPRVIKVTQQTLDGFCAVHDIDQIHFLKIDTEGFELSVLKGASRMLQEARVRFISCEFAISDAGKVSSVAELLPLLEKSGYVLLSTYLDYVIPEGSFFANGNALFLRPST